MEKAAGSGQFLHNLLKEAVSTHNLDVGEEEEDPDSLHDDHEADFNAERQLQNMIDNYQNHVLKQHQQHRSNGSGHHGISTSGHRQNGSSEGPVKHRVLMPSSNMPPPISHSQPCLFVADHNADDSSGSQYAHSSDPRDGHDSSVLLSSSPMPDVGALRTENAILKQQLEKLQNKVAAFRKLEVAYERIDNEFTQIVSQREKQEKLEQAARLKMEQSIQRLANENELLQRQVEKLNLVASNSPQMFPEQVMQYNALLNDILPQNKELLAIRNNQQIEIDAQNATLEEQRKHIEMLEKALNNAQDRLIAKERAAKDAAALIDKCTHQQKLLQESLEDKQKLQEEHIKQKAQWEMELTQIKMQIPKDGRKPVRGLDNDEVLKLKKLLQQKEERIFQLESNLIDLQKRYNDELQKNECASKTETEHLVIKIRTLEKDKMDKEKRIQDLLDEKQRIHGQWADERRSLDHRVRLLEQDLRHLMGSQMNGYGNGFYSPSGSPYASLRQQQESPTLKNRAAVMHDSTVQRMEELKQKISDRKALAGAWLTSRNGRNSRTGNSQHSRSASSEHQRQNSASIMQPSLNVHPITLINPVTHHDSGASSSADSTTNSSNSINNLGIHHTEQRASPTGTSNRLASKMPSSTFLDGLPASTRRKLVNSQDSTVSKRTAIALGTSGYKRPAWSSQDNTNFHRQTSIESGEEGKLDVDAKDLPKAGLTTVVEVNRDKLAFVDDSAIIKGPALVQ